MKSRHPYDANAPTFYRVSRRRVYPIKWFYRPPSDNEVLDGRIFGNGEMHLAYSISRADQSETLIHELLHHADPELEEDRVDKIAKFLKRVGQRNPNLLDWLVVGWKEA